MTINTHYTVSNMSKEEFSLAIDWAKREGWNPGLNDATCFYQTDPHGFFVGKLDGKIIATGSAVIYDEQFAFCGFYIVDNAYRGHGYGMALTKARLEYIGDRNAGLDGVVNMLAKYANLGYKLAYNNARYCGKKFPEPGYKNANILPLAQVDFPQICTYDRLHFPAARETFLRCWLNQEGATSLGYINGSKLQGFGVMRPCFEGYKIGPLFADNPEIADALFLHLVAQAKGQKIYLDLPEINSQAIALAKRYKLEKVFQTARMYLKNPPEVRMNEIYGITSFELG